jgi:prepilin-type N-terminal cleavage/methylation domain-containing protein
MRRLSSQGFTLIELLVVIAMIMILAGSVTASVVKAQRRAKIARATAECREITNAILAYENYVAMRGQSLKPMSDVAADRSSLGFILGDGGTTAGGDKIPVLYNGALRDGKIIDPWGRPYRVTVQEASGLSSAEMVDQTARRMSTSLYLPNYTRLGDWERSQ